MAIGIIAEPANWKSVGKAFEKLVAEVVHIRPDRSRGGTGWHGLPLIHSLKIAVLLVPSLKVARVTVPLTVLSQLLAM